VRLKPETNGFELFTVDLHPSLFCGFELMWARNMLSLKVERPYNFARILP